MALITLYHSAWSVVLLIVMAPQNVCLELEMSLRTSRSCHDIKAKGQKKSAVTLTLMTFSIMALFITTLRLLCSVCKV
jgi:hypothetical protein